MNAITALFETIEIQQIQFEEGAANAAIKCLLKQGKSKVETTLYIGFSDLNRLLAKLQINNETMDYSELFDVYNVEGKQNHYESNTTKMQQLNCTVNEISFYHPVQQVRA